MPRVCAIAILLFVFGLTTAKGEPSGLLGLPLAYSYIGAPVLTTHQYHSQNSLGLYSYGYANGQSAKQEEKSADGTTRGAYSYVDALGQLQTVQYTSDPVNGFRILQATNLPKAPQDPALDAAVAAAKSADEEESNAVATTEAPAATTTPPEGAEKDKDEDAKSTSMLRAHAFPVLAAPTLYYSLRSAPLLAPYSPWFAPVVYTSNLVAPVQQQQLLLQDRASDDGAGDASGSSTTESTTTTTTAKPEETTKIENKTD